MNIFFHFVVSSGNDQSYLHLRDAAVDEQFNSRDITRVARCEKYYGLCDLIGSAESPKRNSARDRRPTLFPAFPKKKRTDHSTPVCRWSPGLSRSPECGDPLNLSSMFVQRNARRLSWRCKHCWTRTLCWRRSMHSG